MSDVCLTYDARDEYSQHNISNNSLHLSSEDQDYVFNVSVETFHEPPPPQKNSLQWEKDM